MIPGYPPGGGGRIGSAPPGFRAIFPPRATSESIYPVDFLSLDPWQYRLSKTATPAARVLGTVWLETGADLPVTEVLDSRGKPTGVILGFALDLAARTPLASRWQAPAAFDRARPDDYARSLLPALGGRFLLVLAADGIARVYPDVAAQVSCVFDSRTGSAGSTATALLDDKSYEERFNARLYERLGVEGEGWFPAGLTAHSDIHRLLPGHCLDLEAGRVHRFWPSTGIETCADTDAVPSILSAASSRRCFPATGGLASRSPPGTRRASCSPAPVPIWTGWISSRWSAATVMRPTR